MPFAPPPLLLLLLLLLAASSAAEAAASSSSRADGPTALDVVDVALCRSSPSVVRLWAARRSLRFFHQLILCAASTARSDAEAADGDAVVVD